MQKISYARHRFPPVIIQHAVWLYFRFPLSYRDIEDLLAERGIDVSYETVRRGALKFGQAYARRLRTTRPRPDARWGTSTRCPCPSPASGCTYGALSIARAKCWISWFQSRRNKKAALKMMRGLLKKQGFVPVTVVTDKLPSYGAALKDLGLTGHHDFGGRKNNRAENSHSPVRQRERRMQRFKSARSAQRLLSTHATVYNTFTIQRHLILRKTMRRFRNHAMSL